MNPDRRRHTQLRGFLILKECRFDTIRAAGRVGRRSNLADLAIQAPFMIGPQGDVDCLPEF